MRITCLLITFVLVATSLLCQDCKDSVRVDSAEWYTHCNFQGPPGFFKSQIPVCGCDGKTYLNENCARLHGVKEWTTGGGCQCIDSSLIEERGRVFFDSFYYLNNGFDPVCGCDGKTYINAKVAYYYHGVTRWQPAPCDCFEESFKDYFVPDWLIDTIIDPRLPYYCACDSNNYQDLLVVYFLKGLTHVREGKCVCFKEENIDQDTVCPPDYDPVCGCDTITYRNECVARYKYGLENYSSGECKCFIPEQIDSTRGCGVGDLFFLNPVCGCDSVNYWNPCAAKLYGGVYKYTEGPCQCIDSSLITPNIECSNLYNPVCGCNDSTYFNICEAEKIHGVNAINDDPCRCFESKFIDKTIDCEEDTRVFPVCGCDSITYINACVALHKGGVTSWSSGPCSFLCVDSFYIDTTVSCSAIYDPVCGCDSITYQNECVARNYYGVTDWTEGECLTSLENIEDDSGIKIYPIPAHSFIYVKSDKIVSDVIIYGMDGNMVLQKEINASASILQVQSLASGTYILKINASDQVYAKKLLITR